MVDKRKVSLRNFGAVKIFVLTHRHNKQRQEEFKEAWQHFDGFDYEFFEGLSQQDITIPELLEKKLISPIWYNSREFSATKGALCIGVSHKMLWEHIYKNHRFERILILEDDARPSNHLLEGIFDGTIFKILNSLDKHHWDIFYWGLQDPTIKGNYTTDYIQEPLPLVNTTGHAYMFNRNVSDLVLQRIEGGVETPNDTLIDTLSPLLNPNTLSYFKIYSPYKSMIMQRGMGTGEFFIEDKNRQDYTYSTTSQVNPFHDPLPKPYNRVCKEFYEHLEKWEETSHEGRKIWKFYLSSSKQKKNRTIV